MGKTMADANHPDESQDDAAAIQAEEEALKGKEEDEVESGARKVSAGKYDSGHEALAEA